MRFVFYSSVSLCYNACCLATTRKVVQLSCEIKHCFSLYYSSRLYLLATLNPLYNSLNSYGIYPAFLCLFLSISHSPVLSHSSLSNPFGICLSDISYNLSLSLPLPDALSLHLSISVIPPWSPLSLVLSQSVCILAFVTISSSYLIR